MTKDELGKEGRRDGGMEAENEENIPFAHMEFRYVDGFL